MKSANWSLGQLLRMSAGLLIWCSGFLVLYAGLSLGCRNLNIPVEAGVLNSLTAILLVAAVLHAGALLGLLIRHYRRPVQGAAGEGERSRLARQRVEGIVLWISLTGLVFIAFPLLMVPPCAG